MPKPLLLNLIDSCLAALPEQAEEKDFYWDWGKRIKGLNKKHDNGYSLLGDWVEKEDQLAWQRPGLYLFYAHRYIDIQCERGRIREQRHLVSLFDLNEEGIATLLHAAAYPKSDWAVQCWETIDRWLFDYPSAQTKLKQEQSHQNETSKQEQSQPPLTANSAIALEAQSSAPDPTPIVPEGKTPLQELMIRFAIEAQLDRRKRLIPLIQVDISAVPQKQFAWGMEKLFDVYRLELAREIGVHWALLPEIEQKGTEWLLFEFRNSEDE